jgi:SAM-dependent methyltransferase
MRLVAKAIGGYYPTPDRVASVLASWLVSSTGPGEIRALDPCCGTGRALDLMTQRLSTPCYTVGVELNRERAAEAQRILSRALHADVFKIRCTHQAFSLLFLNPPYDDDAGGRREEEHFLKQTLAYLAPKGILVYLIPLSRLAHPRICTLLTTWCTDLTVLRFPSPEYEVFKQGIVLGTRKARGERNPTAAGMLERDVYTAPALSARPLRVYTLPRISTSWDLTSLEIDPVEAQRLLRAYSPLWQTPEAHYYCTDYTTRRCHPLLPPRKAHVATLTAAGLLNNAVIDGPAGPQVLKGSIRKQFQVDLARSDEDKTVMREQLLITIKVIDTHGIITTLT